MRALHIVVDSHFAALIGDTNSEAVDLFIDSTNTRHAALVLNTTEVLLHIDDFTNKDLVHFVAWLRHGDRTSFFVPRRVFWVALYDSR